MIRSLITDNTNLLKSLIIALNLEKITENHLGTFYKKGAWVIVYGNKQSEIIDFLESEFATDTVYLIQLGRSIDMEHEIGDIILPNIFFSCDADICHKEVTEKNRDSFITNPQFLEIFDEQKDYYIEDFGLSIGGIAVSKTPETNQNIDESLMMAYAGDIYFSDDISQLIPLTNHETISTLILSGVVEGKKPSGLKDAFSRLASNLITTVNLLEKEDK